MQSRRKGLTRVSGSRFQLSDVRYRAVVIAKWTVAAGVRYVARCTALLAHVSPQDWTRDLSGFVLDSVPRVHLDPRIVRPAESADLPILSVVFGRFLLHAIKSTNTLTSTSVGTDVYPHMPILRLYAARYSANGASSAVLFIVQCVRWPICRPILGFWGAKF